MNTTRSQIRRRSLLSGRREIAIRRERRSPRNTTRGTTESWRERRHTYIRMINDKLLDI